MSSHHIVKEDQEPALIVADLDVISPFHLDQLLEWSPLVVVSAQSLGPVAGLGIKVDVLIAEEPMELPQDHIKVLSLTNSFLDAALGYLVARGCGAVNILSRGAQPELLLRYAGRIHAVLLTQDRRIFAVRSAFRQWKARGERIYLYEDQVAYMTGLARISDNEYTTEADGFYGIRFAGQWGVVGEQLS